MKSRVITLAAYSFVFVLAAIFAIAVSSVIRSTTGGKPLPYELPKMCSQGEIFVTVDGTAFKCVRRHTWRPL